MLRSFPIPEVLPRAQALLALCRLRWMISGVLPAPRWEPQP